jgi:hypothetical protein
VAFAPNEAPFSWLPTGTGFEEESGRIVLELGIVGWGLSLFMRLAFLVWALRLTLTGQTFMSRATAVMALPFMALGVQQGNGVFAAPYMAVAYWFAVALLAMAQQEDRSARAMRQMASYTGRIPNGTPAVTDTLSGPPRLR